MDFIKNRCAGALAGAALVAAGTAAYCAWAFPELLHHLLGLANRWLLPPAGPVDAGALLWMTAAQLHGAAVLLAGLLAPATVAVYALVDRHGAPPDPAPVHRRPWTPSLGRGGAAALAVAAPLLAPTLAAALLGTVATCVLAHAVPPPTRRWLHVLQHTAVLALCVHAASLLVAAALWWAELRLGITPGWGSAWSVNICTAAAPPLAVVVALRTVVH